MKNKFAYTSIINNQLYKTKGKNLYIWTPFNKSRSRILCFRNNPQFDHSIFSQIGNNSWLFVYIHTLDGIGSSSLYSFSCKFERQRITDIAAPQYRRIAYNPVHRLVVWHHWSFVVTVDVDKSTNLSMVHF